MPIFSHSTHRQNSNVCMGYLIGKFTVCMGCVLSQRDGHIYCENGHPGAYIHVNMGIGMSIFT